MNAGNVNANYSAGTQINRLFDALGYPDKFGDAIGALVDLRSGNVAGAFRNLVDLNSGLSTKQMDSIFGGPGQRGIPGFGRGFVPRCHCHGPHLHKHTRTYAVREQVGKRAHIGQKFGYNWGPFKLTGRISGREYVGSFAKPIKLENGDYLYRGRTYDSKAAIYRDARDGRVDGQATSYRTRTTYSVHRGHGSCIPPFFGANLGSPIGSLIGAANPFNPMGIAGGLAGNVLNQIFNQPGGIFGGIPAGIPGIGGGSNGSNGSNGTGGAGSSTGGGESVLSNPNLTLEDKLALLMAKLSEHLDKQIEAKMGEIEKAMQAEKSGGANGAGGQGGGGGIGGILGSVGQIAGGAAGMYFGGPIGASLGSSLGGQLGGALGGAVNSAGGAGAAGGANGANGADGSKPNLQLLQTQLQEILQKRQQMFQTMSSILKSLHDTSMNAIRNLKA